MIEEGIVARLYATPAVVALIGAAGIYPVMLPKDALADAQANNLPAALTFQRIGGITQISLAADRNCRLMRARYQFDAWSFKYLQTKVLRCAVRAALLDFRGALADAGATVVQDIVADDAVDMDSYEDGPRCWRSIFDFIFWYQEKI